MAIRKYRSELPRFFQDDLAWIDEWFNPFRTTFTYRGQWVDPDKFDIIPKPDYRRSLIEEKQKEIDSLEEQKKLLIEELNKLKSPQEK